MCLLEVEAKVPRRKSFQLFSAQGSKMHSESHSEAILTLFGAPEGSRVSESPYLRASVGSHAWRTWGDWGDERPRLSQLYNLFIDRTTQF